MTGIFQRSMTRTGKAVLLALLLASCSVQSDVSDRADLWGGYEQGRVYTLNFDVFLMRRPALLLAGGEYILSPPGKIAMPGSHQLDTPYSVAEYETGNRVSDELGRVEPAPEQTDALGEHEGITRKMGDWGGGDVIGVVREGTRLRASYITSRVGWDWVFGSANGVNIFAEILDGPFAGTAADLVELSQFASEMVDGRLVYDPVCVVFCDYSKYPFELTEPSPDPRP